MAKFEENVSKVEGVQADGDTNDGLREKMLGLLGHNSEDTLSETDIALENRPPQ